MKCAVAVLFALFAAAHAKTEANPLVRVMGLLKDLSEKLEKEAEEEKDLWTKYHCWATSTVAEKESNIAAANDRVSSLNAYVADVEGGKLTFTSNKAELEKELADVLADIENLTAVRTEHHRVFEINKENEEKAIEALTEVIDLMKENTADIPSALLQGLRGSATSGSGAIVRRKRAGLLVNALEIGDKYLSEGNAHFLRRILTGKAEKSAASVVHAHTAHSTKSDYKARKGNVTGALTEVEVGIEHQLESDVEEESSELKTFEKTSATKEQQKKTAEEMLAKLVKEAAARAKAVEDSKAEIESLEAQVAADQKTITDITAALEAKETDFNERETYRQGEIAAVGEAMEVLNSDEARDTIRAATSFIQISSVSTERSQSASQALMSVYGSSKDSRLLAISTMLNLAHQGGAFDKIYQKIDAMVEVLNNEEARDLEIKDNCTRDKTANEAEKEDLTNMIEDLNTTIAFSSDKIKEMEDSIASKQDQIAAVEASMAKALEVRQKEKAEYDESKSLDQASVALLEQAASKVSEFYESQKAATLIQIQSKKEEPEGAPDTWKEGGYKGAGSQAGGVVGTIKMLADDLKKEIAVADKEEAEALKDYEEAKADMEEQISDLGEGISDNNGVKSQHVTNKQDAQEERTTKTGELASVEQTMAELLPGCTFYLENFEARSKNRRTEINGLLQAKSILEGSHSGEAFTDETGAKA